ncbi:uncharacterized protein LOC120904945 [Anopheles arabiensis]|uniref:uncharacterized protein LOC120904945 n=1 Tax=Anopheles arabiensis TaxID=7173 RepID=UPI001AAD8404|nr:uncharacterized protein LOC120904945 [Anopheles arabiensis]
MHLPFSHKINLLRVTMCRGLSAVLILLISLSAQLHVVVGEEAPKPEKEICGLKVGRLLDSVKGWLSVSQQEKCPLNKYCENKVQANQYNLVPLTCIRWRSQNPASPAGSLGGKDVVSKIDAAMSNFKTLFEPMKADLAKLEEEIKRQVLDAWKALEPLQKEVYRSTLTSGRIERAVFYSFMEMGDNVKLDNYFQPANVEELLKYAWTLPMHKKQRSMYDLIGQLVQSSKSPMLQTLHAVELATVVNPELENRENLLNDQVVQLRDNLYKNSFATLVSIARHFPDHFDTLRQRLFKLPDGSKPGADTLPNIVNFIAQLPSDELRLSSVDLLLQSLTAENGTLVQDPEYVYRLSQLAHAMPSLVDVKAHPDLQQSVDDLMAKFNTPIDGKTLQYFQNIGISPSSSVAT